MSVIPPRPKKGPKTQRLAEKRLRQLLNELGDELSPDELERKIPEAWSTLEEDLDVEEPKVKITLRLDRSVATFFRGMGKGYQARMNRVLATYAQMRIAQVRFYERELDDLRRQAWVEARGWDKGGTEGLVLPPRW